MIVNCDKYKCIANIAGECVSAGIKIVDGKCQENEESSTGEIIEQVPLVHNVWDQQMPNYKIPSAYENIPTETAYRTEEEHERV